METAQETHKTGIYRSTWTRFLKRSLDIIASITGLILLSPIFAIIAQMIKRSGPGPIFYRGERVGRDGRIFRIIKFRTMVETSESHKGARITAFDDERITPLGRWLRDTKINEIPQLWNVLVGEMSLVGPRPEEPQVATHWSAAAQQEILSVRPGITSPASVIYRNEEKLLSSKNVMDDYLRTILPDKERLDRLYVRTYGFVSDLDIIFATLISLFPSENGKPIPEAALFAGTLTNIFRRHISWFVADSVIAFIAAGFSGLIWRLSGPLDLGWGVSIGVAVVMALFFGVINTILGLGRVSWQKASPSLVFDLALSSGLATLVVFLVNWLWPGGKLIPPGMVVEIGILAYIGFIGTRYRQRLITGLASRWLQLREQTSTMGERLLIIGAGDCGQLAGWLLNKSNLVDAFTVVGMVDDDPLKQNLRIDGHIVLGTTKDIPLLVEKHHIGVILYAITRIAPVEEARILVLCRRLPARLVIIPDLIKILQEHLLPRV